MFVLVVLLLLCSSSTVETFAQYRFDNFTTSNGLPQNTVSAITQTRDGYLWFATYDGLVRYDGVRFTIFDKGNTAGINTNRFLALREDKQGTLWVGTVDGGLIRYRDGAFTSFTEHGFPENYIGRIQLSEKGLLLFFGTGGKNYLYWTENNSLAAANIFLWAENNSLAQVEPRTFSEYVDRSGARWVFEKDKVIRLKGDQREEFPITLEADEFFRFHYEDRVGNMWFGTRANGAYHIADDRLRHYTDQHGVPTKTLIRFAGEDNEGNVWLYSERELIRYKDGQFISYSTKDGLTSRNIRAVFCDREGTIWVGTNESGLYRLTRQFLTTYSERNGLPNKIVYPILEDRAGNIWISSGGLTRFVNGRFTVYPLVRESKSGISKVFVSSPTDKRPKIGARSLYEDREGRLWIGHTSGLITLKDGRLTDQTKMVASNMVNAILQDRAGNFWIGTQDGLFKERDGATTFYATKDGLPDKQVIVIYEDKQGNLWVGTQGGLARLEGDRFIPFTTKEGLVGDRVRSIYGDHDGALWIGTFDSGLSRFKDGRFTKYTTQNGLFNNGVFQILEDSRGNFWMSCNRGIYRVSRQQLNDYADGKSAVINCVAYGSQDGMLSAECNGERQPAGIKARDGKLWFPTQNGVVVIDPDAVPYNSQPPLLTIESILIDHNNVSFKGSVQLEPGQTDLEINYSAPSSIKAEYIQFKYKLVGLNDDWVDAGTRRTVNYSHLPPGRYTFKVIAANNDGVWNEVGATLDIYKKPYFYQTRWFLALSVIGFIALAASIYALRVHQLKVNERRLTTLVAERTAELRQTNQQLIDANRAKSAFLSNMSHELRTPLNAVIGFAQLMERDSKLTAEQRESLGIIERSGEHLLGLINDVLSISKIEAGRLSLSEQVFDPHKMLRSVEEMLRVRAESKNLTLLFEVEPNIPHAVKGDEGKLRQVLVNLLGNAIKFTEEGGVVLRCRWSNDGRARFEIEDTGVGIAEDDVGKLFEAFFQTEKGQQAKEGTGLGLAISRQIVRLMGGDITVRSKLGVGTIFSFDVDLPSSLEEATQAEKQKVVGLALDQPSPRVLVVDDTLENRVLLSKLLLSVGIQVREATNGQEAIDAWSRWHPDLIFMDLRMPVLDGYEATRQIRAQEVKMRDGSNGTKSEAIEESGCNSARQANGEVDNSIYPSSVMFNSRTKIIALTASAFEHERGSIIEQGADDFIAKPFREETIFEKIAKHLGTRFCYEETEKSKAEAEIQSKADSAALTPERFAVVSPDIFARLEHALRLGDDAAASRVADELQTTDPALAAAIQRAVKSFDFDMVLQAIVGSRPNGRSEIN